MPSSEKPLVVEKKIVVVFDICSSSNIIEDLTLTDSLVAFKHLLTMVKQYLRQESHLLGYRVYKFTGDGWILLFPAATDGQHLMTFLTRLSKVYRLAFKRKVFPFLQSKPGITGLTFGIDQGNLMKISMLGKAEFVGRPLNIACRLQNAIKDKDKKPSYKVLASKPVFRNLLSKLTDYKPVPVTRTLRNIIGGKRYQCVKMRLPI